MAQKVKNLSAMQETWVWYLGPEDPLEKGMATPPIFLPGEFHGQRNLVGYSSWNLKTVGHNWVTNTFSSSNSAEPLLSPLVEAFPYWISRYAELKVVRTGSKEPANGLLDVTVREATHTTAACILAAEARTPFWSKEYTAPVRQNPILAGCCLPTGTIMRPR